MPAESLTQARLKELLHYDPDTGAFIWINKASKYGPYKIGDIAGNKSTTNYRSIRIDNVSYYEHRLAFLYMNGCFPMHTVDHINHNRFDNRWFNLRDIAHVENMRNMRFNDRGSIGVVYISSTCKWRAYIGNKGEFRHIGCYESLFEAVCARKAAEIDFGYHENHGMEASRQKDDMGRVQS